MDHARRLTTGVLAHTFDDLAFGAYASTTHSDNERHSATIDLSAGSAPFVAGGSGLTILAPAAGATTASPV